MRVHKVHTKLIMDNAPLNLIAGSGIWTGFTEYKVIKIG